MYEIPKITKIIICSICTISALCDIGISLGENDYILQDNMEINECSVNNDISLENTTKIYVELNSGEIDNEIETPVETQHIMGKEEIVKTYTDYDTPTNNAFKSYMDYRTITDKTSEQYKLQKQAYTEWHGIRVVDDKYCIAVGSYYSTTIGQNIDVILKNDNVIHCIVADLKKDIHTDSTNRQNPNGSIVEFIVDTDVLHERIQDSGDISFFENVWGTDLFSGEIDTIRVYR